MISLAIALAALTGCTPTCEATCEKLLDCDAVQTPLVSLEDCTDACLTQEQLYDIEWEDTEKVQALDDFKVCVAESECADIADAVCYNEDIYPW